MTELVCPLCKKICGETTKTHVYSIVNKHFRAHMKSNVYGYCQNPTCDIVYFGIESDEIYFKRDLTETIKE